MAFKRTVKRIIDGDTIEVNRRIGNTRYVRLANVNAPEKYQFGGRKATNVLRGLIGGQQVSITPVGKSYNRILAQVRKGRKSINKRMREKGY
jgi:endonuclease YncB( thermonuclease family)